MALIPIERNEPRTRILLSPQGVLNGDEAYTGLQAAEIARGHFPVVIGGAAYTGTLDVFALAPIIWATGQHVVMLKMMSPVLWAGAAVLAVGAARRIVTDRAALLAGSLVWLAPGALAILSTRSYVAYALVLPALFLTGSMGSRTSFLIIGGLMAVAFACYGYRLLRTNKWWLWLRILGAIVCFTTPFAVLYAGVMYPY